MALNLQIKIYLYLCAISHVNINISHKVNNIEFIKTNESNTYYLKNSSKDEYLYIKTTNNYGENGKSILWHKGILPKNIEDKKKFEFEFEINTDEPNIDLSILYSPFNMSEGELQIKKEYYIQTFKGNNISNYLTTYSDNIKEALLIYILATQVLKGRGFLPTPAKKAAALTNRNRAAASRLARNIEVEPTVEQAAEIDRQITKVMNYNFLPLELVYHHNNHSHNYYLPKYVLNLTNDLLHV